MQLVAKHLVCEFDNCNCQEMVQEVQHNESWNDQEENHDCYGPGPGQHPFQYLRYGNPQQGHSHL